MRHLVHTTAGPLEPRRTSRRSLLAGAARLAGGGALAATVGGPAVARALAAPVESTPADLDLLRDLVRAEQMAYALYDGALRRFNTDRHNEDRLIPRDPTLLPLRDHEQSHLAALTRAIQARTARPEPVLPDLAFGGDAGPNVVPGDRATIAAPRFAFGYEDHAGFLRVAVEVEEMLVAAYAGALGELEDPALREMVAGILAVEGRHAAHLSARVGADPFPLAIEPARPRVDVAAFTRRFTAR